MSAQPTEEVPYSETLLYRHDLYAMDYIARRTLLLALAELTASIIDEELFNLRRKELRPSVEMAMCITLPARVPVGIIGPSGRKEEEERATGAAAACRPTDPGPALN